MGEFFSNLVSRSMERAREAGGGAILRPRLPSLFETPDGTGGMAMPRAGEVGVEFPPLGADEDGSSVFFSRAALLPSADDGETLSHRRYQANRSDDMYVSDAGEGDEPPESVRSPRRSARGEHRPIQPEQSAEPARPFTNRREEAGLAGPLLSEGAVMERVPREKQPSQVNAPDADLAIRPRIERYQGTLEKPPVLSIDPGRRGEDGKPAAERYGQSAEEAQAPTVHISIGRIEVRAVTQPAPQPAPKPVRRQPRLSLEDYLRQRNEGKR